MKSKTIKYIILIDLIILILSVMNFITLFDKVSLPNKYSNQAANFSYGNDLRKQNIKILKFQDKIIDSSKLLEYYLLKYDINDTVKIEYSISGNEFIEETSLVAKYNYFDLLIMFTVSLFYFFTGVYILKKYKNNDFSWLIHFLCIFTAIMIICEWGDFDTYPKVITFLLFVLFETSIFLVPSLFLHFSFNFPQNRSKHKLILLLYAYITSFTFLFINTVNLVGIFFFDKEIAQSYFLNFHSIVADIFLALALILTIAKLEHSSLNIKNILIRKQIYWVLLGISFGPLIYIFMIIIPRHIMETELISTALMQFSLVIAPIMFLISITRKKINIHSI